MILITGGAGSMGADLTRGLVQRGFPVRVLVLPGDPRAALLRPLDCEVVEGDITRPETLAAACRGVRTVYHLAAVVLTRDPGVFEKVNVQGLENMLAAAQAAGAEHFIHISSASVTYRYTTAYSRSKLRGEEIVRAQSSINYTIVRPTLAYNEQGGEEFQKFVSYLLKGPVAPVIGSGQALKAPVHTADLMEGFLALAGNRNAWGRIYNFSGNEEITVLELTRLILELHEVRKPIVHLPVPVCRLLAATTEAWLPRPPLTWQAIAGLIQDANLDNSQARRDLGFRPRGVRDGLRQCLRGSVATAYRKSA